MKIDILPLPREKMKKKVKDSELGFGKIFTDRMFFAEWKEGQGWINARIQPYAPFVMDPSCLVFHYGQEIFEGLKAYQWEDRSIALFRPEMNAKRFNLSADRLCMPSLPDGFFLEAIEKLVYLEKNWIPCSEGTSLYIRPTMIACEPILGVRPSSHYYFYIILSPVGAYYTTGLNPVKILVEDKYVRAALGGTGEAKTGGNYASSIRASLEAKKKGFDQVLWLDCVERRYVEEVGAMNIFFLYQDKLVTPPLKGSILHGVTRDSVLKIVSSLGFQIEEKQIDINELMDDVASGKIKEIFGSGTAAVITPVGVLSYKDRSLTINNCETGDFVRHLYNTLTGIQYGKIPDAFGWMRKITSPKMERNGFEPLASTMPLSRSTN